MSCSSIIENCIILSSL